jgi:lysozyme
VVAALRSLSGSLAVTSIVFCAGACSSSQRADVALSSGCPAGDVGTAAAALASCPAGPTLKGIDVSTYQGAVQWKAVRDAGTVFAIARVSNGTTRLDDRFAANWPAMKAAGIVRGSYQYFRPAQDPLAQAELMLSRIEAAGGLEDGDLPPVLDLETDDGEDILTVIGRASTWLSIVETRIGRPAIIYTGWYFGSKLLGAFAGRPLWVAAYKVECPKVPDGWARWHFWQSSEEGVVPGIAGKVDLDHFDGTKEDLLSLTMGAPLPVVPPPPEVTTPEPATETPPLPAAPGTDEEPAPCAK